MYNEVNRELAREYASREFILAQTEIDEYLDFIKQQIKQPFDSGDINYFRKMMRMITDKKYQQDYAKKVIEIIVNEYENIDVDIEDLERDPVPYADALYRFFGKNLRKLVSSFLVEYLYNSKNRKMLLAKYDKLKLPVYPKEQFGTRENYLLIVKISSIVDEIISLPVTIDQFLNYAIRNDDMPSYCESIVEMINDNILVEYGVYEDIMRKFKDSDTFDGIMNKVQIRMMEGVVRPTVEDMGFSGLSITFDIEEDSVEDSEDEEETPDVDNTPMAIDNFEED